MPVLQSVWTEGALTFTFAPDACASKYDEWAHYRNQFQATCGGSKAVDLVHLDKGQKTAWLIEVKDFRQHPRTKSMDLPDEIALKVRDTLAGLLSASWHANDSTERKCARSLVRAARVRVVCHLEQPAKASRLRPRAIEPDKLILKLRTLIKAIDPHPLVVDCNTLHDSMTWHVA
ncbi:hypothetical protein [Roseateles cavernae]|uniref:hypothetical protein n=1 Tax=Roseateles cavernae TaxID=3153578 RepID=UPI0032E39947